MTFDLNGNPWRLNANPTAPSTWVSGYNADSSQSIGYGAGESAIVNSSSSSAGTNTVLVDPAPSSDSSTWIGGPSGSATLNINTNLGCGVRVWLPNNVHYFGVQNARIHVNGRGAELRADTYGGSAALMWNITGGGKAIARGGQYGNDTFGLGGG